ncbi:MAG: hypothetical protein AAF495_13600 [Pseudomonadota bacterium]
MTMLSMTMGHLFRSPAPLPEIKAGAVYRRRAAGQTIETARVTGVGPDGMGIPHVRFEVLVEHARARRTGFADRRILSVQAFSDSFVEA